jgi:hypothetical protein
MHRRLAGRTDGPLFIEELIKGFSWSVCSDGPRVFGHFHWEPSPSFAIDIRRTESAVLP